MNQKAFTLILIVCAALTSLLSQSVVAATKHWKSIDNFWYSVDSWDPEGVPTISDDVFVSPYGGIDTVLRFDSSTGSAHSLVINSDTLNTINFLQTGGSLTIATDQIVGSTGTGSYTLSGGSHTAGTLTLGQYDGLGSYYLNAGSLSTGQLSLGIFRSHGSFIQSGGTNMVSGDLSVGGFESSGNYELNGGSLLATNETIGGYHGNGSFTQGGGTNTVKGNLTLGFFEGLGSASYSLNGGDLFATNQILISDWAGSIFDQKGGTNTVNDALIVGIGTADPYYAGSAEYYLSGGSLTAGSVVVGAGGGTGVFVQSNGTNTVKGSLSIGTSRSSGSYVLSEGGLSVSDEFIGIGGSLIGNETGVFTQSGGTHVVSNVLIIGSGAGDPEDPYFAGSAKYYLSGGSLSAGSEVVGTEGGAGTFVQSGGTHMVNDTLILGEGWGSNGGYNLSAGILSTGTLVLGDFRSSASFTQSGGTNIVSGYLIVGGFESSGNYELSGGSLLATNETIGVYHGQGSFTQSGGTHVVNRLDIDAGGSGGYVLSGGSLLAGSETIGYSNTFKQSGGTNTVSNQMTNNGAYTLSGGTLLVNGGIDNSGTMMLIGGTTTVNGNVTNAASGKIGVAYSPVLFTGNVFNSGQFKTTQTTVTFTGTYTENGAYISDSSINNFADLVIDMSGYLAGGAGDEWHISGSFVNHSLQNTLWNTVEADLFFDGGGVKNFYLASADYGLSPLGFSNNFAFGSLHLASGVELNILDGNATPGGALYVSLFSLGGGIGQLSDINSDYNIYYDPYLPGNAYLLGNTYALNGGGILAPAIPEPEIYAMLLAGLSLLGFAIRHRRMMNMNYAH